MCFQPLHSVRVVKVVISKIFILLSFTAPMAIISNCMGFFGPHFSFSFLVRSHRSFLCLFGHNNRLLASLADTRKKQYAASHTGELKSEFVKRLTALLVIFPGNTWVVVLQMQGLSSVSHRLNHHCVASFGDR